MLRSTLEILFILLTTPLLITAQTLTPDVVFEQKLIDLGYDTGEPDGSVPTENIETVTILHLGGSIISPGDMTDLTGLEDFAALEYLNCGYHDLDNLNVSGNSQLTHLICSYNFIQSLDLSNNPDLTTLSCTYNSLTELDLTNNLLLDSMSFQSNGQFGLSTLDLTANVLLKFLWLSSHHNMTDIDLSNNVELEFLHIDRNGLTSLDLSDNPILNEVYCFDNDLITLNVANGNNLNFDGFVSTFNPDLTCIEVDDGPWSTDNWTVDNGNIHEGMTFSELCNPTDISEFAESQIQVYPNPSTDAFTILIPDLNKGKLVVSDLLGKQVISKSFRGHKANIDLGSAASSGTYVLTILDEHGRVMAIEKLVRL
jgi:hypothetical protein